MYFINQLPQLPTKSQSSFTYIIPLPLHSYSEANKVFKSLGVDEITYRVTIDKVIQHLKLGTIWRIPHHQRQLRSSSAYH